MPYGDGVQRVKWGLIPIFVILSSGAVQAAAIDYRNVGAAFYAIQSNYWRCDESLKFFDDKEEKQLAFLWSTFGDRLDCLRKFFALDGRKFVEIHPFNEASRAKGTLNAYELLPKVSTKKLREAVAKQDPVVLAAIKARVAIITETFYDECSKPEVECVVSTGLEHRFSRTEDGIVAAAIREVWPWGVVSNPVGGNSGFATLDYYERHGVFPKWPRKPLCLANLDGVDIHLPTRSRRGYADTQSHIHAETLRHYVRRNSHCRAVFLWWHETNCKPDSAKWITQRNRRNCATFNQISLINKMLED